MRIAKYLARCGLGSRRQCEPLIQQGSVKCNGITIKECGFCVPNNAIVEYQDNLIQPQTTKMFLYHKPPGLIVSRKDHRTTIFDAIKEIDCNLVSVGRLDFLSEGLMVLTNHGELARKWEKAPVERIYNVITQISGRLDFDFTEHLCTDGIYCKKPKLLEINQIEQNVYCIQVALIEGKNRELRNIWRSKGWLIRKLIRISYGIFSLDGINKGCWKQIKPQEPEHYDTCERH